MKMLKITKDSKYVNKIKHIYESSFPEIERIDFDEIINCKFPNSKLLGIFNDKALIGFSYISTLGDFAYIIYLAIEQEQRNKKYGSEALKEIYNLYKDKTKVLCVEKPVSEADLSTRRIEFYKRNGYELADFEFDIMGQTYYSMYNGEYDKQKFIDFLLVCFPGCENFNEINNLNA